jgi:uncharacterized repeat protein (TIGR01451 family)
VAKIRVPTHWSYSICNRFSSLRRLIRICLLRACILIGSVLTCPAHAVTPIDGATTEPSSGSTTGITNTPSAPDGSPPFGSTADLWDVTFTGSDSDIADITVGTNSYSFVTLADELRIQRKDNPQNTGVRELIYCRGAPVFPVSPNFSIACEGSSLTDMATILLGRSLNYGTDNIFTNNASNDNNIERIDYIYKTGINVGGAVSTGDVGFVILERGGNDNVRLAAILSVDAGFNPSSFGPLVQIGGGDWGYSGTNYQTVVFRRDPGDLDYRPSADLGSQNIDGTLVTFADLNIDPGTTFFGYALFPDDVIDGSTNFPGTPMDLVGLTDVPLNTSNGLDLVEGGGFFQKNAASATTALVDLLVTKVTNNPVAAPGSQVTFTITVDNLTPSTVVVDAAFEDIFPTELTDVAWTCQAFGADTTCLGGSISDTGSASPVQPPPNATISDVVNIGIGGKVVYVVTATLSATASGIVDNTASVATAEPGQADISESNNSDTASITVQAPATGNKQIYLTSASGLTLSRVQGDSNSDEETVADGVTQTWTTNPDIVNTVTVTADIGLIIAARATENTGSRTIDFTLRKVAAGGSGLSTEIATAIASFNVIDDSTVELLMPAVTMSMSTPFDLDPGDQLALDITPSGGGIAVRERQTAADANMSRIELTTSTVINVDSISFLPATAAPGEEVQIITVVSDPFGENDITSVTFEWFNQDNQAVMLVNPTVELTIPSIDSDPATRTYSTTYTIPPFGTSVGNWRATVTAVEGQESSPVVHTDSALLPVVLPNITNSFKSVFNETSTNNNAGDRLAYSVTIVESGGVARSGVRVVDPVPSNTTLDGGSLSVCEDTAPVSSCTSLIAGTDYVDNSTSTTIDVSGIEVPASGEVRVAFDVVVNSGAVAGDLISNEATITAPETILLRSSEDLVVFGAPLSLGAKFLYFDNANLATRDLTRAVPDTETETRIIVGNSNDNVVFTMTPALTKPLTIPDDTAVNIALLIEKFASNNDRRDVRVTLTYGPGGTGTTIGELERQLDVDNFNTIQEETFVLPAVTGDVVIPAGNSIALTVTNTSGNTNREIRVRTRDINTYSQVGLDVTPVINIDSFTLRTEANGGGTAVTNPNPGSGTVTIYARAIVSDPFGEADIEPGSQPVITITPPAGSGSGTATQTYLAEPVDGDPSTRTFEWEITIPQAGSGAGQRERGLWLVQVTAEEGEDDLAGNPTISHTLTNSFTTSTQANLSTSTKTVNYVGEADPSETITYTITLINGGGQPASNVSVTDALDALLTSAGLSTNCVNAASAPITPTYSGGSGGTVTTSGIRLAGGASCTIIIQATIADSPTADIGDLINNQAFITNPNGPSTNPQAPTVIVSEFQVPSPVQKQLYLEAPAGAADLTRSTSPTQGVSGAIGSNGSAVPSRDYDFTDAITRDVVFNTGDITAKLWLHETGGGGNTRDVQVDFLYDNGGGFVLAGSQELTLAMSSNSGAPSEHNFSFPVLFGTPVTLNADADFRLRVYNNTTNANRFIYVHQVASNFSQVTIPLLGAVEVTEMTFWTRSALDDTDPCSPNCGTEIAPGLVMSGEKIWLRSTIADAFGSSDVNTGCIGSSPTNCPTITLRDPASADKTPVLNGMVYVNDILPNSRQYEFEVFPAGMGLEGVWEVETEGTEGTEGVVFDSLLATFERFGQPSLTILKSVQTSIGGDPSADEPAAPYDVVTYMNDIMNASVTGTGPAYSVIITNTIGAFVNLKLTVSGAEWTALNFLTAGYSIAAGTEEFFNGASVYDPVSFCGIANATNSPCYDPSITSWRIQLNEPIPLGATVEQNYQGRIE